MAEEPAPELLPKEGAVETLREGVMQRRFIGVRGGYSVPEFLVLLKDRLLISKCDDPERKVFDDVLLRDVIECELKQVVDDSSEPTLLEVIFRTEEHGYNCGRSYMWRSTYKDAVDWEATVDEAVTPPSPPSPLGRSLRVWRYLFSATFCNSHG